MRTRDYSRRIKDRGQARITQRCSQARNIQGLQRLGRSGYERDVDDGIVRVYRSELSGIGGVMIDIVLMRRWTMVVRIPRMIHSGVHMQLGRLHVHHRESGNQHDREYPTGSP